jgi:hypothetical protein
VRRRNGGAGIMDRPFLAMLSTLGTLNMDTRKLRWTAFALSCLLLAACKDKHDPLKPTVAAVITATAAAA